MVLDLSQLDPAVVSDSKCRKESRLLDVLVAILVSVVCGGYLEST